MNTTTLKAVRRARRKKRIRKTVYGTPERPRLTVFRSLKHIYAQLVDDTTGRTLVAADTRMKDVGDLGGRGGNVAAAKAVGKLLGTKAVAKGIQQAAFDRNGYKYHGRVKALAEAAREAGLKI
ncbi:MAG TPA: 50S ribosomal protein L18 [Phycisphaerae bacterium]|jgi:large subunit ribosomal protein L18|nr:50S ribosomal protein L18 [Phycisphaerae bacterium]HOB75759.1 50S ribosomal protein L18 [Phycisphaerae bacterium]HOJ55609.1 50S ribosomal protein L18 [Phycisphaerae bacterium]HOL27695.1 50S ribosomal protein L18 [Phycisphaerae bacterium]HPP21923.1 50S ribosomal protein L18 [Phycisphaerae bacterium]